MSDPTDTHPLCEAFFEAADACGYPRNPDCNGATQAGFGYNQVTQRNGRRCSTAVGYLRPARSALQPVRRDGRARDAHPVLGQARHRHRIPAAAARSRPRTRGAKSYSRAGAFGSPQLMQLSGLGPASHLQALGIPVVADMPGVGANLQDHYNGRLVFECTEEFTLNDVVASPLRKLREGLRYYLTRKGFLTMAASTATGFVATDGGTRPDVQIGLVLYSTDKFGDTLHPFSGLHDAGAGCSGPRAAARCSSKSADPLEAPEIRPNYLSTAQGLRRRWSPG